MNLDYSKLKYMDEETHTVAYLSNCITDPSVQVGEHTYYHDFHNDPADFVKNNILYHFPGITDDKIVIGKYCSLACGTSFICPSACHNLHSLSSYPFGIANHYWNLPMEYCTMDVISNTKKGPTIVGNDVWFGYQSLVMPGVKIGDGAVIGTRSIVTKDVEPYTIVAGAPARPIRKRYDDETIAKLLELKWWDLPDEDVREILPDLISNNIDAVVEKGEMLKLKRLIVKCLKDMNII